MADILVVDDEKNLRKTLCIALEDWGHTVMEAGSGEDALRMIEKEIYDVILTDLVMDGIDGIELLRQARQFSPESGIVLMSGQGTVAKAVEALHLGALDFIVKPFSIDHLEIVLKRILNQIELKQTIKRLQTSLADHYPFDDVIAVSQGMREVMHQVTQVADWNVPVLIQGESGVGKELVAIALHQLSSRNHAPFVPVNCGSFPDTLLDSELFGHCQGAFTGATANKRGLIEEANGGTLLLDEIGEAPTAMQVRLLRFLDNGQFRRVGETTERESDVRVIAATNRDLMEEIKKGSFREDLYYRLSVAVIHIPPLRERKEDIAALTKRFLDTYKKRMKKSHVKIRPEVYRIFQNYDWPGNVRELENTIEHAMVVTGGNEVGIQDLPDALQLMNKASVGPNINRHPSLEEVEKNYILSILEETQGNKKRAAEILNISRTTLISRLKSYELDSIKSST